MQFSYINHSITFIFISNIYCCIYWTATANTISSYVDQSKLGTNFRECLINTGIPNENIIVYSADKNSKFSYLNYQWNILGGYKTPAGYLIVRNTLDVQNSIICGKSFNIRIVPKGGGHSYEKYSFGNSLSFIIDLQLLDQMTVNEADKTCIIGAGALLGQIGWTLYRNYNLVFPHGTCLTVGLSGLALGGGYGYLSRLYGLTTDNIIELKMVDSSGSALTINKRTHSDLFWALRGAGSGSFGIITSFKFKAHSAPNHIIFGSNTYDLLQFPKVFAEWQNFLKSNSSKEINTKLSIFNGKVKVEVFEIFSGPGPYSYSNVKDILTKFPQSSTMRLEFLTYSDFLFKTSHPEEYNLKDPSQFTNLTRHSFPSRYFKAKSFFVNKYIGYIDIWTLYLVLQKIPNKNNIVLEFYLFGGAIDEIGQDETSFIHRGPQTIYLVQVFYQSVGKNNNKIEIQQGLNWLKTFYKTTKLIMKHNESYQNYADGDMKDALVRYYGDNLKRLTQIKRNIDPTNYFNHPQSIPL